MGLTTATLVPGAGLVTATKVNSDTIMILERAKGGNVSGWMMTHVPVGKGIENFDVSPDGHRVLVSYLGSGDLLILDTATRQELNRISLGHGAAGILAASDGSRAFIVVSFDGMAWEGAD